MLKLIARLHPIVFALYVVSLATTMSGMEAFSALLALILLARFVWDPPSDFRWRLPPFSKPLLAFIAIALLGILLGSGSLGEKRYDASRMRFFLLYAVLFFQLRFYARDLRWVRWLAITTALVGGYAFVQHFMPLDLIRPEGQKVYLYAIPEGKIGPLVVGFFNHHLTFANIFVPYACLFFALGFAPMKNRFASLLLGTFLFVLCVWTNSRAAWIAIPVVLVAIAFVRSRKIGAGVVLACGIIIATSYLTDAGFRERFSRTFLKQDDYYNIGPRRRLWRAQWEIFKEHPLLGVGYNGNERMAKKYVDKLYPERTDNEYGHAHSTPLQILSTTGILGFGAFVWLWVAILLAAFRYLGARRDWREEQWLVVGTLAAFLAFHIQGMTQWNFGDAEVLHNLMFLWAFIASRPGISTV